MDLFKLFILGIPLSLFLAGCGKTSDGSGIAKDLFKGAFVSAGCAMLEDPDSCLESAFETLNDENEASNKNVHNKNITSSRKIQNSSFDGRADGICSSDLNCGTGRKCVKKRLSSEGVCMNTVDTGGFTVLSNGNDISPTPNYRNDQCKISTDCPINFYCHNQYRVCVRR